MRILYSDFFKAFNWKCPWFWFRMRIAASINIKACLVINRSHLTLFYCLCFNILYQTRHKNDLPCVKNYIQWRADLVSMENAQRKHNSTSCSTQIKVSDPVPTLDSSVLSNPPCLPGKCPPSSSLRACVGCFGNSLMARESRRYTHTHTHTHTPPEVNRPFPQPCVDTMTQTPRQAPLIFFCFFIPVASLSGPVASLLSVSQQHTWHGSKERYLLSASSLTAQCVCQLPWWVHGGCPSRLPSGC